MQFEFMMQVHFPELKSDSVEQINPSLSTLRLFKTLGIVMNVFLLDPEVRLLAGFVWISRSNSISLYVLFRLGQGRICFGRCQHPMCESIVSRSPCDIFTDSSTRLSQTNPANQSCILCDGSIVIHSEKATFACRHFFPLSILTQHITPSIPSPSFVPQITTRLNPARFVTRNITFPILPPDSYVLPFRHPIVHNIIIAGPENQVHPIILPQVEDLTPATDESIPPNPWSDKLWYPESAHFVR